MHCFLTSPSEVEIGLNIQRLIQVIHRHWVCLEQWGAVLNGKCTKEVVGDYCPRLVFSLVGGSSVDAADHSSKSKKKMAVAGVDAQDAVTI